MVGCNKESKKIRIAISKASGSESYLNYAKYITSIDPDIEIVDFYKVSPEKALEELKTCDGLLLSGGPDAHPGRFGRPEDTSMCSIDLERDTLEFAIIDYALKNKLPILGICRGEQLLNVALGGDLIVDIPSHFEKQNTLTNTVHQYKDKKDDSEHTIRVSESSLLYTITGTTKGKVNSNHHQAVGKISSQLYVSSRSEDGIPEAIEWNNKSDKSWLIGVQWHPERLKQNPDFSEKIGKEFIQQVKKFAKERK